MTTDLPYEIKLDLWLRVLERHFIQKSYLDPQYAVIKTSEDKRSTLLIFNSCLLDQVTKIPPGTDEKGALHYSANADPRIDDLTKRVRKLSDTIKIL